MSASILGYMQLLSKAKHSLTAMSQNVVLPIDRHGFAEGFVSFRTLCGVQSSSLVIFAPNRAIAWGPPQQWQAP